MDSNLGSRFTSGAVFVNDGNQDLQHLIENIVRCLEGESTWPEGKEIFYGKETKWDNLNQDSPQTGGELSILSHNYGGLSSTLEKNDWIVELGVGTGIDSKAGRILHMAKDTRCYVGVDRNERFVYQHIARMRELFPHVVCMGLVGEFDNAYNVIVEISRHFSFRNGCLLSMGSTISNNSPEKLIQTLRRWSRILPNMIIGQDSNTDAMSVGNAYRGHTFMQFIWAGLKQVNKLLQKTIFVEGKFEVKVHIRLGPPFMVEVSIKARDGMTEYFKDGREVIIFTAYKYQEEYFTSLVQKANRNAFITPFSHSCTESRIYSITFPTEYVVDLVRERRDASLLGL